jgi:hypothetical protein
MDNYPFTIACEYLYYPLGPADRRPKIQMKPPAPRWRPKGSRMALSSLQRFARMIAPYKHLAPYCDFEGNEQLWEFDIPAIKARMGVWSHGEQVLAKFFMALWQRSGEHGFDFFEPVSTLDELDIKKICAWAQDPFWP